MQVLLNLNKRFCLLRSSCHFILLTKKILENFYRSLYSGLTEICLFDLGASTDRETGYTKIKPAHGRSRRPEKFCKKRQFKQFRKIHRKTPVPESLFKIKLQAAPATLLKKRLRHRCFLLDFCETFKNTFFKGHLRTNAADTDKEHVLNNYS